jgi:hypothetical protein
VLGGALALLLVLLLAFALPAIIISNLTKTAQGTKPPAQSSSPLASPTVEASNPAPTTQAPQVDLPTAAPPPPATPFPTMTGASISFPSSPREGAQVCTITGAFLTAWKDFKGRPLANPGDKPTAEGDIGWPLENVQVRTIEETPRRTQLFSRALLVDHSLDQPAPAPPNDVTFAPLGSWLYVREHSDQTPSPAEQRADCRWFPETGHNLCDPFRSYWEKHALPADIVGKPDDQATSLAEAVARRMFGFPISEEEKRSDNGQVVQIQWFQNARLEYLPKNEDLAKDGYISIATLGEQCGDLCRP